MSQITSSDLEQTTKIAAGRVNLVGVTYLPRLALAASTLLTALGVVAFLQNRTILGAADFFDPVTPVLALGCPLVGTVILARRPANAVGWVLCATALASVSFFAEQYGLGASRPGAGQMTWLASWTWLPILAVYSLLLLLFPDGHPPSQRWKPLVWTGLLLFLVSTIATMLSTSSAGSSSSPLRLSVPWASGLAEVALGACALVLAPLCLAGLAVRYRGTSASGRPEVAALLVAAVLAVLAPMAGLFLPLPFHQALGLLAIGGIPASIVVAMARHRLFGTDRRDIDRLTSQTILCAAQVTAGVLVSGLALWALDTRLSLSSEGAFLGAMVIVVATWSPLHRLIARAVERALSPTWAYHALITLGNRLESTIAPDDVVPALAETVSAALGLAYVAVEVGDDYGSAAAAVRGIVEDDVIVVPLVYQQEMVGRLTVGPHFGKRLEPTDLNLLHELAIQASPVLYAVRLTADLRQSKDRLVTAREEEWRRLRRELHDRLGPLSATRLGLKAAWNHLTRGKLAVAQTRLEELDSLLAGEIDHIRRLGDRLRPRAVGDLDLLSVLREKTALWALPPRLAVTLEADGLGSLPPGVAVAVYQIVVEAVTNARCHGHAQTCRVRLACDDGMVKLEVRDDGVGLGPSDREGDGICDMRERAVELGGTCSVQAAPDRGTVVSAEIPLEVR